MINGIPRPLASVIGDIVGTYHYNHTFLNTLFYEAGASGEIPQGNCVRKTTDWLVREGKEYPETAIKIMGKILEDFMDGDREYPEKEKDKSRIVSALGRYGLSYSFGGRIYGHTVTTPSRTLEEKLRDISIPEIEEEFQRAYQSIDSDPPTGVTAACAIIEALCQNYISEKSLERPAKQTILNLWKIVSKDLNLSPDSVEDDDLKRILSGLTSITDGIGSLRTHSGSAHGHGKRAYRLSPRHARLAVHSAHTLCLFVLETWLEKRGS